MKLSEAIGLGRMLLKPVPGIRDDGKGGGCAFGMASAATDGEIVWCGDWLYRGHDFITLPCDCKAGFVIGSCMKEFPRSDMTNYSEAIVHVFNYHVCTVKDWTLDQLIEWIASIEPAEEEAPVAAEEPRVLAAK